jgi:hypothetical protein
MNAKGLITKRITLKEDVYACNGLNKWQVLLLIAYEM